jgi:Mo-nitrogenase iron protein subunit nifH
MPVMDYYREYTEAPDFEHIGAYGFGHVFCMETGGPTPGLGCAGRGIIATFDLIDELEVFEKINPEIVLYDVLGDVVCGGFSAPIRDGYAEEVCIVTSGEKMSLYAAHNIYRAVQNFQNRGYASVKGLILNRRNVEDEYERVKAFADERKLPILADIPRSKEIQVWEDRGMTVIEGEPDSEISIVYRQLAQRLLGDE